jgi:hypothetical protein
MGHPGILCLYLIGTGDPSDRRLMEIAIMFVIWKSGLEIPATSKQSPDP